MLAGNPVKRLGEAHPNAELWWDSSPLIYADWARNLVQSEYAATLFRVADTGPRIGQFTSESLLEGSTTNQPLTWQVIAQDPETWSAWVQSQFGGQPELPVREGMWRLFIEVAARGADLLCPIFEASDFKRGQICCQVDPRDVNDLEAMLVQARRIHRMRPNLMVKMPGSKEGIEGVRILTSEGIPTNVTLVFTLSQMIAVGEAAQAGLTEARRLGTDLKYWRSCCTMMLGRYEDAPTFQLEARERGFTLTEADLRWAGIAIFRKAYRLYRQRRYPTKLLGASMRPGPTIDGKLSIWHLEKLAGGDAVLTIFPKIFEAFLTNYVDRPIEPQIEEPVPDEVLDRLLPHPYFVQAYEEEGLPAEEYSSHPAFRATADSFIEAMLQVEQFVAHSCGRIKVRDSSA